MSSSASPSNASAVNWSGFRNSPYICRARLLAREREESIRHIDWDGSEDQNDLATANVTGVATTLTDGIGTIPLDHSVLGAAFEDEITPVGPAIGIFTDDEDGTNALSVDTGIYKVVFLAFPFEAYGDAADQSDLMQRVMTYFGT